MAIFYVKQQFHPPVWNMLYCTDTSFETSWFEELHFYFIYRNIMNYLVMPAWRYYGVDGGQYTYFVFDTMFNQIT